jgi:hypothetical protein
MIRNKLFSALVVALVATGFVASSVTWTDAFAQSKSQGGGNQGGGPGASGPGDKNPPGPPGK